MVVESELTALGHPPSAVTLGEADLPEEALPATALEKINRRFRELGFALLEDRAQQLTGQIKSAIITLVHRDDDSSPVKHSTWLAEQTGRDYTYLSRLFSETEGITIEQYIISQKIERVKELLTYGELTLSEIAWKLGYSSVAALSGQFKKVTGMTPSAFKATGNSDRKPLDSVGR
jgi:AraC-like DNA-binding protein